MTDNEEPYPSLSDYHDYEPNLEFDDTELQSPTADIGKSAYMILYYSIILVFLFYLLSESYFVLGKK